MTRKKVVDSLVAGNIVVDVGCPVVRLFCIAGGHTTRHHSIGFSLSLLVFFLPSTASCAV